MDDISLGQNFDVLEDASASDIVKQVDQLTRLFGAGCQCLNDQASPPVAKGLPDQVILSKLICHHLVTYGVQSALSIASPLWGPTPPQQQGRVSRDLVREEVSVTRAGAGGESGRSSLPKWRATSDVVQLEDQVRDHHLVTIESTFLMRPSTERQLRSRIREIAS